MQQFGDACRKAVGAVVVGRRVSDGSAVVVEGVACPDAAVGVVEMVVVRVEVAFLPFEVPLQHGEELSHLHGVGIV